MVSTSVWTKYFVFSTLEKFNFGTPRFSIGHFDFLLGTNEISERHTRASIPVVLVFGAIMTIDFGFGSQPEFDPTIIELFVQFFQLFLVLF